MERKEFQEQVIETFQSYIDALAEPRQLALDQDELRKKHPALRIPPFDWPAEAWLRLRDEGRLPAHRAAVPYNSHQDGAGRQVPSICFKVPTGGGKTMLAAECAGRLLTGLEGRNSGVVLWIVPNDAIYTQTLTALRNREHPYRQILDRAAAGTGNVRILEKDSPLNKPDVGASLCVMVLMFQSAKRQDKTTLRFFRDRGDVHGFVPPMDDMPAHEALIAQTPNLEKVDQGAFEIGFQTPGTVRNSLGNALRICQPVIVMDEGHYAYTELAMKTLYDLNPSFVLELSATPNPASNILVDVAGAVLEREEMIKLPINVTVEEGGQGWKNCLRRAYDQTNVLQSEAERLYADGARYVRPILLVQVERTSKDQRESGKIHADDARELLHSLGVSEDAIAEKTAENDELKKFPYGELLKPTCPIRVIITKQALQEGWDCPFAYVLCSLAASRSLGALTQLVGRILRQPEARKTGRAALDECYVYCHDATTGQVVQSIRKGLEQDGMGDLAGRVVAGGAPSSTVRRGTLSRREKYASLRVYLPRVLWVDGENRDLDYERDILSGLDWGSVDVDDIAVETSQMRQTRFVRIDLDILGHEVPMAAQLAQSTRFDPVYATRAILDIVPNPWEARRIVGDVVDRLLGELRWDETKLGEFASDVISTIRWRLEREQDRMAEELFRRELADGRIEFHLHADARSWKLPDTLAALLPEPPREMVRSDGSPIQNSVFRVFEHDVNELEILSGQYLDRHDAVAWWHRNVARGQGYGLQGWRRHRVYPDLLIGLEAEGGVRRLIALETKGDQLSGNLDTVYKQALLEVLTGQYSDESHVGRLELEVDPETSVRCDLVIQRNWQSRLATLLSPIDATPAEPGPLEWIAATELRNWCEGEPALDWLNLYGETRGYLKDTRRPDYRPETDMSVFIREKGQAFEGAVLDLLRARLTVETAYQSEDDPSADLEELSIRARDQAYERTLALMRAGMHVIHQPVVMDPDHAIWGKPDLLVRSDCLSAVAEIAPLSAREVSAGAPAIGQTSFHYVVVDIKYESYTLRANGELGADVLSKKVQVAAYTRGLAQMQGFQPPRAFLLGRSVDRHGCKGESRSCLTRLAPVVVAGVLLEVDEAAAWARRVRRDGVAWDIENTQIPELQLNMSNQQDGPWHMTKREIAGHLHPVSALWQVTPDKARRLFQAGIFRWDDPNLDLERYTRINPQRLRTMRAILGAQKPPFLTTPPGEIRAGRDVWGKAGAVEFYVDFETVSDLDDDFQRMPDKGGSPRIFMVGCGHIEEGEWRFSVFTANAMTDAEEARVLREWVDHMQAVRRRLRSEVERPLVFHWSKAEVSFLSSAYNSAIARIGGDWLDVNWYDLLSEVIRAEPFVVHGALAFGLKAVAKAMHAQGLIRTKWEDGPVDGLAAMVGAWWCAAEAARRGIPMTDIPLMQEIAAYNEVDCKVMWEILSFLRAGG